MTIVQGGPKAPTSALLIAGKIDFYMGGPQRRIDAVKQGIPIVDVAAIFQKDPQVLIAHPDAGVEKFEDLAKLPTLFMSKDGYVTYFEWMKANFPGFNDEQYKPYNFNPAPFLADKQSVQQGYLTSEPYAIEKQAGFEPKVFLLADDGYSPYSTTITHADVIGQTASRRRAALRRCLDHRLVQLSLRRQHRGQRADQERQSGNDRRADRLFHRQDEGIRHRGIRRRLDKGIGCMTDAR